MIAAAMLLLAFDSVQSVILCRTNWLPAFPPADPTLRPFSACCVAAPSSMSFPFSCCSPTNFMWEEAPVCVQHEADGYYLSLDSGMYGFVKLLATAAKDPNVVRAKLQEVIPSPGGHGPNQTVYMELNSTISAATRPAAAARAVA